jgi:hypothetical protein
MKAPTPECAPRMNALPPECELRIDAPPPDCGPTVGAALPGVAWPLAVVPPAAFGTLRVGDPPPEWVIPLSTAVETWAEVATRATTACCTTGDAGFATSLGRPWRATTDLPGAREGILATGAEGRTVKSRICPGLNWET